MKQNHFVRINEARWQQFSEFNIENANQVKDYPEQFRQICADLALARSRQYSPALIERLNHLVQQGQQHLYQSNGFSLKQILRIFTQDFPRSLYDNRLFILGSTLAFWGLGLIAFFWVLLAPDHIYWFVDPMQVNELEAMYDPSGDVQTGERGAGTDVMMFGFYVYNNIGIAFQMFGGGALLGIGAIVPLLFNSFFFGAISAHIVNVGYTEPFFSFVIGHGSFELMAIVIAGAAGCKIGFSILNPGALARKEAIKIAGASVLPLICGAFVMLLIAAFVEAFWSSSELPVEVKFIVGTIGWFWVLYRLYRGCRYAD
ncbi:stage II sporulation protein M [Thalassotalea sp. PS06]|uniref:stage II sporulation protein M n=1 Tax=Thalassotalea sp. PS06 TaxID=2594005 RepID=UPI001163CEE6|nr:stage II sporulation protein M [Thalassotalea sp. PS06]QDP02320.1 stage II sporulation protein M [Thalassotalea sp. PS06]